MQLAIRTGVSFPVGSIGGDPGDGMSRDFGPQVPVMLEVGAKIHPMVFIGAYTALSFGGASSTFQDNQGCGHGSSRSCLASDLRIGAEVQVHFRPSERVDPWAGYGLGFESASVSASGGGGASVSESVSGLELARFAGGVDFRISRLFGVGPFLDLDFGSYSHSHAQYANGTTGDGSITNTAAHAWITLGARGVLFP